MSALSACEVKKPASVGLVTIMLFEPVCGIVGDEVSGSMFVTMVAPVVDHVSWSPFTAIEHAPLDDTTTFV
jgi:hypothetical protein